MYERSIPLFGLMITTPVLKKTFLPENLMIVLNAVS